jgi:hypothetical protein
MSWEVRYWFIAGFLLSISFIHSARGALGAAGAFRRALALLGITTAHGVYFWLFTLNYVRVISQ